MELLTWEMNLRLSAFIDINLSISAIIDRVSRSTDTKHIRILRLRKKTILERVRPLVIKVSAICRTGPIQIDRRRTLGLPLT